MKDIDKGYERQIYYWRRKMSMLLAGKLTYLFVLKILCLHLNSQAR